MAVIDATALGTETELPSAVAIHLRAVCLPIIEKYSPDAPDAAKSEALIRMSSWLDSSRGGLGIRSLKVTESLTIEFRAAGSALRLSGSSALLSPWRRRTTGRCEAAE